MEHNKINNHPWNFDMNIINVLEEYVIILSKEEWKNDSCPPKFIVSLNNEDINNQSIMITIDHLGSKFTERLFPRNGTHYGYDSILSQMINMYNQTM